IVGSGGYAGGREKLNNFLVSAAARLSILLGWCSTSLTGLLKVLQYDRAEASAEDLRGTASLDRSKRMMRAAGLSKKKGVGKVCVLLRRHGAAACSRSNSGRHPRPSNLVPCCARPTDNHLSAL